MAVQIVARLISDSGFADGADRPNISRISPASKTRLVKKGERGRGSHDAKWSELGESEGLVI